MRKMYAEVRASGQYDIKVMCRDFDKLSKPQLIKWLCRFMKLYARAGAVVICDNFLPAASCSKRRETKVIQLWHACGCYKKFGYDAADDIPEHYHGGNVYRNADLVTVSGEAAVGPFSSAMRLPESCVRPLGVSRTDLYRSGTWVRKCKERFYEKYPEAGGKTVVLWAPTFRGNAGDPENISIDIGKLQKELGEKYLVLTRLHPHMMRQNMQAEKDASCPIPTEELYPVTDVLIADYSSLIYEYLLFSKPAVLYCPDLDEYRSGRGFYMDISEIPGEIVTQQDEQVLADAVRRACADPDRLRAFLDRYMGACDGQATDRIVEWLKLQKRGELRG